MNQIAVHCNRSQVDIKGGALYNTLLCYNALYFDEPKKAKYISLQSDPSGHQGWGSCTHCKERTPGEIGGHKIFIRRRMMKSIMLICVMSIYMASLINVYL